MATATATATVTTLADTTAAIPEFSLAGRTLQGKVVACYDGDTFHAVLETAFGLWKFACRMAGYDTPEMKPPKTKPDRDIEKARAVRAKQALLSHIIEGVEIPTSSAPTLSNAELDARVTKNRRVISITCKEFDKYGRLLVDIEKEDVGNVGAWMVREGFGYAYDGGTKDAGFATRA